MPFGISHAARPLDRRLPTQCLCIGVGIGLHRKLRWYRSTNPPEDELQAKGGSLRYVRASAPLETR